MMLSDLIAELSDHDAYAFPIDDVEIHQTHISVVFLAGPFAFKIKKPVQLGFLDFSTLEKRRHFCDEEVRLNRRLAPDVYLGVIPITRKNGRAVFEGDGEVIEWAVKMKRLPQDATLQQRLLRHEVTTETIQSLAGKIAAFHREPSGSGTRIAEFGSFEMVAQNARENIEQAGERIDDTLSRVVWTKLNEQTESQLTQLRPLIEQRAAQGLPRDTHGDLHLDHVYLFPDEQPPNDLVIVDCIEFNERFRFADPVADMAFLVMDLIFHCRRDLARAFADAYFLATGDNEGRTLLPFYVSYRAAVRGKVEGMELSEKEIPQEEQTAARKKSRAHWLLALGEVEHQNRKPCLLLIGGLPGAGKSTLAKALAAQANFSVIRSDEVRKELAGIETNETASPDHYSPEWNKRTYEECLQRAEAMFFQGKRVLMDANFWEESKRRQFLDTAAEWGVPAAFFFCKAPAETARQRLQNRQSDVSDADWEIYSHVADKWQAFSNATRPYVHVISTDSDATAALHQSLAELGKIGLFSRE